MIQELKERFAARSRRRRAALFRSLFHDSATMKVIDLGGGSGRHFSTYYDWIEDVTVADFNARALAKAKSRGFRTRQVAEKLPLPFADREFDIVFCSSVIEHVSGPKAVAVSMFKANHAKFLAAAREHQARFADEIRRIGRRYFVQTPNRRFVIESHSWLPFLGFLPTHLQWRVMWFCNAFWPRKNKWPDWALLDEADMRRLFPEATIYRERVFGLTKSFIAVGPPGPGPARRTKPQSATVTDALQPEARPIAAREASVR